MFKMSKNILYVVMAPPPNSKSAGITYLNNLATYLRNVGKNAITIYHVEFSDNIFFWSSNQIPNQNHYINPWKGAWEPWSLNNFKNTFSNFSLILIHGENVNEDFEGRFFIFERSR